MQHSSDSSSDTDLSLRLAQAWRERALDPIRARESGMELLDLARAAGDTRAVAAALHLMAWGEIVRAGFVAATEAAEQALGITRAEGDMPGEALAATLLGIAQARTGNMERARELHERADLMAREIGDREIQAMALNGLGHVLGETGEYAAALEVYRNGLAIAGEIGSAEHRAQALLGIGNAHESVGAYGEALASYTDALALADEAGLVQLQAYATGNIGLIHERIGEIATALAYELRSLDLKESLGDRWAAGVSLNNIGLIYQGLGDYARALEYLLRALECAEGIGDRSGEMIALHNIAHLYETLGERTHVLDYHQRVLEIAVALGDRKGEAVALGDIGRFHARLGDDRQALLHMLRSLRIQQEIDDRFGQQGALEAIAGIHQERGDTDRAVSAATQALEVSEGMGDRRGIIASLVRLGSATSARGEHRRAIELLERAFGMAREGGYTYDLMTTAQSLAEVHQAAGNDARSRNYQRLHRESAQRIFGAEESRRIRGLMEGLQRRRLRDKAASLGLGTEDLDALLALDDAPARRAEDAPAEHDMPASPVILVRTFGELRVTVDGRALRTGDWGRKKARDLFKFLLIHHRRTITMDEIIERLWNGAADRNTELLVMNAISRIRRAIEPDRSPRDRRSMVSSMDRTYRLDLGEDAEIDFVRFKELMVLARGASSARERYDYYEQAAALYTDDFLKEDAFEAWAASERDLLKDAFLEALEYMAGEQLRSARLEEAIATARRILPFDDTSERGYEILLEALLLRGRPADARQAYEECRAAFDRVLGAAPPASIRRIMAGIESAPHL